VPTISAEEEARLVIALALAERYAELLHVGIERCEEEGEPLTERQQSALLMAALSLLRRGVKA
jgi:hypothetical protein